MILMKGLPNGMLSLVEVELLTVNRMPRSENVHIYICASDVMH